MDRLRLRQMMVTYFSLEDFKDLCFALEQYGVAYDSLPGDGLPPKARELILLCDRAGLQSQLLAACQALRPNVQWAEETATAPPPAAGAPTATPTPSAPAAATAPSAPPPAAPSATPPPAASSPATPPDPLDPHFTFLLRRILDGRLVPFLGVDVNLLGRPADAAWRLGQYFPSNDEMVRHLASRLQELGYSPSDATDLAGITEDAALALGVGSLYDELRGLFNADYPPTPLHALLAALPGQLRDKGYRSAYQTIVTGNFDDMLERAFQARGEPYDVVTYVSREDLRDKFVHTPFGGAPQVIEKPNEYDLLPLDQRTIIVKIYGALDRLTPESDSYVITEDDFIGYMARSDITALLPATLVSRLRKSHFLFLGASLRDWDRRVVFERVWEAQKLQYRSWAVPLTPNAPDERYWQQRDIELIRNVSLQDYVARLAGRLASLPAAGGPP